MKTEQEQRTVEIEPGQWWHHRSMPAIYVYIIGGDFSDSKFQDQYTPDMGVVLVLSLDEKGPYEGALGVDAINTHYDVVTDHKQIAYLNLMARI